MVRALLGGVTVGPSQARAPGGCCSCVPRCCCGGDYTPARARGRCQASASALSLFWACRVVMSGGAGCTSVLPGWRAGMARSVVHSTQGGAIACRAWFLCRPLSGERALAAPTPLSTEGGAGCSPGTVVFCACNQPYHACPSLSVYQQQLQGIRPHQALAPSCRQSAPSCLAALRRADPSAASASAPYAY